MDKEQVIQRAKELAREYVDANDSWDRVRAYTTLLQLIDSHPDVFPDGKFDYKHEVTLVIKAPRVGIKITEGE